MIRVLNESNTKITETKSESLEEQTDVLMTKILNTYNKHKELTAVTNEQRIIFFATESK